jgi:hypothetical protein
MPTQADYLAIEDANPEKFPAYEVTHGLPKAVRLRAATERERTNLLTGSREEPINFRRPKHRRLRGGKSLMWDAYLLWRLSERYGRRGFAIGKLDRDRVVRLEQLGAIRLIDANMARRADEATMVQICWSRQSLNGHYRQLQNIIG